MGFQDHFSGHAADYAAHRPTYPQALFRYLASLAQERSCAWDCATGNGQAACALAEHFAEVVATDASERQLRQAVPHPKVRYLEAPAEDVPLEARSVDLVTVAQALHWFELEAFYQEVGRVLKPGGLLAVWCYGLTTIAPEIDAWMAEFHHQVIGPYWPIGREHIEARYETLPFPYQMLLVPALEMRQSWTLEAFAAYLRTWSAVKRYLAAESCDPVGPLEERLRPVWGEGARGVSWPLTVKVGRST